MSQVALFVALQLVGALVALAIGPRHRVLAFALGFPVGLAVVVLVSLLLLVAGLPYGVATVGAGAAMIAGAAAWRLRRRPDLPATLAALAASTAIFAVLAAAVSVVNVSLMTYDSHFMVLMGRVIAHDRAFADGTLGELQAWGVFQVLAHALAGFTRQDYLYALQPVLGLSFVALFAGALWHGGEALGTPRRCRAVIVPLVTAALFTTYVVAHHLVYIHTNLAAAIYLFGFVAIVWLAEVERDPRGLPLAMICLLAFALGRVENPPFALVVLALAFLPGGAPRRAIAPWLIGFSVIIAGWYLVLSGHAPADGKFLTPTRCYLVAAATVGFTALWAVSDAAPLRRVWRHVPALIVAAFALALAAAFAARPDHMLASCWGWASNLVYTDFWGLAWHTLALLVVLGLAFEPLPARRLFLVVPVYLLYVLLLGAARVPYYFYIADSSNRMTVHVVALAFFYVGLELARGYGRTSSVTQ